MSCGKHCFKASRNQVRSYSVAELPAVKAFRKPYTLHLSTLCYNLKGARTAPNQAKRSKRQRRREKRLYYCHDCNAYHLTSLESLELGVPLHPGHLHSIA